MSNWEEKYEKYKNGELDNRINEIEQKVDKDQATDKEYREYDRLVEVRKKLPQIENILELKQGLEKELELIVSEIKRNKPLKEASDKKVILEKELKDLQKDYDNHIKDINKIKAEIRTLKSGRLTDKTEKAIAKKEEKLTLKQEETSKILENIDINNKSFIEQDEILKEGLEVKGEYSDLSYDEMESRKIELFNGMSKCDLAAELLLAGLDWSEIKPKLDNWKNKKFTEKGNKLSQTMKETKKAEASNDKSQEQPEQKQFEQKQPEQKPSEQNDNNLKNNDKILQQQQSDEYYKKFFAEQRKQKDDEFAKKHKILAKIKEIFSKGKNKIKEILGMSKNPKGLKEATQAEQEDINSKPIAEPEKDVELETLETEKDVITAKVEDKNERNEFIKGLKISSDKLQEIAEKGISGIQEEQRKAEETRKEEQRKAEEAHQKELRAELKKYQDKNRENEEKKFGKDYADMSR